MENDRHIVYLVGVNHRIQYTNSGCGSEWRDEIQALEDYLVSKANELKIELLAEEFNQALMERNHAIGCTVRDAARRCGRKHLFCEPTMLERDSLGIDTPDKRENIWLERLKDSQVFSILFVCGDDHLKSVSEKLNAQGVETSILSEEWGKDWMHKQ